MDFFEYPARLWWLLALPPALLLFLRLQRRQQAQRERLAAAQLQAAVMPMRSPYKAGLKFGLWLAALALLVLAWANPRKGLILETSTVRGLDVFLLLDVSASMMAQDLRPDRMERARRFCEKLIDQVQGNRVGLVLFAGEAQLEAPLTDDMGAIKSLLASADPALARVQGTSLAEALQLAGRHFEAGEQRYKAVVVVTDGEDHEAQADEAARVLRESGALIFAVGVGTPEGGLIPLEQGGYKLQPDSQQPVRTRLNEEMLKQLAQIGEGAYFRLVDDDKVALALRGRIDAMEKKSFEQRAFTVFRSYYQYLLGLAILLLVADWLIGFQKNKWASKYDIFER